MKRILSCILFCLLTFSAWAQYSIGQTKGGMEELVQRLTAFGKTIPQEKVFVHMDNTCYFLGDTIWFSAYTRQTNTNEPSKVSGVLYVELYNNDGYLVERKLIEMDEGRGKGFFALNNFVQYSGFYELRAYTRWQLNWGLFEHKHSKAASKWFLSNELQRNFYRDYDKLYSRVFPVYDKPADQMHPERNMTSRVMRRYFNKDMDKASRKLSLTLFPEGGNLVAGVENRVAFEAAMSDGEQLEGILTVGSEEVKAVNRGRGMFTLIPEKGIEREVTFTAKDGQKVTAKLPKPEEQGVAVQVNQLGDSIIITSNVVGIDPNSLAMTLMHEGKMKEFRVLSFESIVQSSQLEAGVHQITIFDTQGHVWADRLFFVTKPNLEKPTLTVSGLKNEYEPYEKIELEVRTASLLPRERSGVGLSLAVRDDYQGETLYDNGNIMTEMLLASEIKGFIPNPGWYFEKDDEEHRTALDLLMMTQGWRRFVWKDMAVKGEWDLTQPNEKTPIITGKVWKNNMSQLLKDIDYKTPFDRTIMEIERMQERNNRNERKDNVLTKSEAGDEKTKENISEESPVNTTERKEDVLTNQETSHEKMDENIPKESSVNMNDITKSKGKLKREVKVHGELIHLLYNRGVVKETETKDGYFRMTLPHFYGTALFFLSASDTTKWKKGKQYEWVKMTSDDNDDEWKDIMKVTGVLNGANVNISLFRNYVRAYLDQPEFFVRVSFPYPHFVKPYNYYQKNLQPSRVGSGQSTNLLQDNTRDLKEINVHARFGGKRRFDDSQPAFIMDYEEAQNMFDDAGMFGDFGRVFVGDYGLEHPYIATSNVKEDRISMAMPSNIYYSYGLSATQRTIKGIPNDSVYSPKYLNSQGKGIIYQDSIPNEYWDDFVPSKIENVLVYSDYCPRQEGDKRYWASNLPETRIIMYPFTDGSRRVQYRDRYYTLPGFAYPAEFYSPDYSKQTPPEPTDYRRTLYWNPNLQLDENGQARITFYNNSRTTQISVEAEGQASDGTLLWSK